MPATELDVERAGPPLPAAEPWSMRTLFARHKGIAIGALALLAVLVAFTAVGVLSSGALVVSDSTTCTEWGSATYTQQRAFAVRYLSEHGSLPGGVRAPASVVAAINGGCTQAYANDVQDNLTVVQAIEQ
jgi:hypothetical protein